MRGDVSPPSPTPSSPVGVLAEAAFQQIGARDLNLTFPGADISFRGFLKSSRDRMGRHFSSAQCFQLSSLDLGYAGEAHDDPISATPEPIGASPLQSKQQRADWHLLEDKETALLSPMAFGEKCGHRTGRCVTARERSISRLFLLSSFAFLLLFKVVMRRLLDQVSMGTLAAGTVLFALCLQAAGEAPPQIQIRVLNAKNRERVPNQKPNC